ncbi:MAG: class I SAM-dependent methyltransferase [Candidatus Thiodiazotropha sp. (ex Dulcina madagascariensis)]|nr:class I SAM-dependent methyltransferase [Candidatus Thiodiazotropha sp. (ex Dulcina madagascariensis)]
MAESIGGNFIPFGLIMRDLMLQYGLESGSAVLDIGCGSGRLANALKEMPSLKYIGIDVVKELLEYASTLCGREDWRFYMSTDFTVPVQDNSIDMVTAFSVFTHLLHEETFVYLYEARRVLKPGGKIIFSFLDFKIPAHWAVFRSNIRHIHKRTHLNQFMDEGAVSTWCEHLKLNIIDILPGNEKKIVLRQPVTLENGIVESEFASLGQSICVLEKPRTEEGNAPYINTPPDFDPELYLKANPDVEEAGVDALEHFLIHGQFEGRKLKP